MRRYTIETKIKHFEQLTQEMKQLLPAEGGWYIEDGELVVHTRVSRDHSRDWDGGDYDFYTCFKPVEEGVLVYEETSCRLPVSWTGKEMGHVIPCVVSVRRLARLAALFSAAETKEAR